MEYPRVLRGQEAREWLRRVAVVSSHEAPTREDRIAYQRELDDEVQSFSRHGIYQAVCWFIPYQIHAVCPIRYPISAFRAREWTWFFELLAHHVEFSSPEFFLFH